MVTLPFREALTITTCPICGRVVEWDIGFTGGLIGYSGTCCGVLQEMKVETVSITQKELRH